ncbi:hypothetical protein [Streptomyces fuscigenes]|uniref:hypothetical protein n=1 Tax=Streptomyces fuscigenes TaxID=1528880 RepID=UPI001F18881A|nr:hypothetical protein [Streptomyces fuscigenes]MCF3960504.1 hypothetical protein [Streptomyces fuscigenes]
MSTEGTTPSAPDGREPVAAATPPDPATPAASATPADPATPPDPVTSAATPAPAVPAAPPGAAASMAPDDSVAAAGPGNTPGPWAPRGWRRAVRWGVAAAVFLGLGAGTAYGVTSVPRDRVPGLATRSDGRWDFPALSLPALPAGKPRPFGSWTGTADNPGEIHFADLRRLVLPAPAGVTGDRSLDGGWVPADRFAAQYPSEERSTLLEHLADDGLRHVAARGWTAPDGTSLQIYAAQFQSAGNMLAFLQDELGPGLDAGLAPDGVTTTALDERWPGNITISGTRTDVYRQEPPYTGTHARMAYIEAGDTLALVVERRKGADAPEVPFHQTVILQQQLLG